MSLAHTSQADHASTAILTEDDRAILNSVDEYLEKGLRLKRWWNSVGSQNHLDERFDLTRSVNRPSQSYGFFSTAKVDNKTMPIMGNFQELFFDQPKASPGTEKSAAEWIQKQLREFVLRYFMRVSSFQPPESTISSKDPAPPSWLAGLSWFPTPSPPRQGFGFSQLYFKTVDGGIGKFADPFAIVDLRDIGVKYQWIVLNVKILNFSVKTKLLGDEGPDIALTLGEDSYIVMTRDFIYDQDPAPGAPGRYGLGYAFIKNPKPGFLAGPGQFDAAIEQIDFHVTEAGEIKTAMLFVASRPAKLTNVPIDPVDWSFRIATFLSLGMASSLLQPVKETLEKLPLQFGTFDPVYPFVALLNAFTANQAAKRLFISRDMLDKLHILQHFKQHYATIVGCLPTWRQISNWLADESQLPKWVVTGRSA